jgi:hypothetical protein
VSCHYVTSLEYNVLNTMIATADSRINRRICTVIKNPIRDCLIVGPLFPSSVNRRCWAIMFAVSRIYIYIYIYIYI